MWQKETADVNGSGSIWEDDVLDWGAALQYCESLSFAGHSDWRLPNIHELLSIVNQGRWSPTIDPVFGAVSNHYWSSSSGVILPGYAWCVYFKTGLYDYGGGGKGSLHHIRAVRTAP